MLIRHATFRAFGLSVVALPLYAQLYVIAGSPTPHYYDGFSAALVRINDDGTVSQTTTLVTGRTSQRKSNVGLYWIELSHEDRKAVLMPVGNGNGPGQMIVVDLDNPALAKECELPPLPMLVVHDHLVYMPGRGLALAEEMYADGQQKAVGILLNSAAPCETSVVDMTPADLLGVRVLGRTGVSDTGNDDAVDVQVDSSGKLTRRLLGVSFPFAIPAAMLEGMDNPVASILVANSRLVVIGLFKEAAPHRVLVYRRRDQTWHRLPIPAERVFVKGGKATPTPWLTGFGDFLALTEARTKDEQFPETAGKAAWRTVRAETGPSMAERFAEDTVVFPGRLHLYDMEHDRSYTITTNQGDSEILLVDGGTVYYRVGDAIYRAAIGETALGPPQLVAKSEIVGDAHWAFIRRP